MCGIRVYTQGARARESFFLLVLSFSGLVQETELEFETGRERGSGYH